MWQLATQGEVQGVWFYSALYTLAICTYSIYFQTRTRKWPSVPGQLHNLGLEKFGENKISVIEQEYKSQALYTYHIDGVEYQGKRVSPWVIVASHNARFVLDKQHSAITHLPNGQAKVFYNPRYPQKSFLVIASKTGIGITLVIALLPIFTYYWKFYF